VSTARRALAGGPPRVARWRAPGRVNLIGEHTDYNDGFALPFAIQSGVTATVAGRADGMLRLCSAQEPAPVEVPIDGLAPGSVTGWAAYPAGVVWAIASAVGAGKWTGLDITIDGDVPLGAGLSSSAAVICSAAAAIDDLFALGLSRPELIRLTREAENSFVGAPTGGMDQTASLLCEPAHALFIDARTMATRQVPFDPEAAGLAVLVTDSRVRHEHAGGSYAERRQACLRAARTLGVGALRDVTIDDLAAALDELRGDAAAQRATRHVVSENDRVLRTVELLSRGETAAIGPLLDASHDSLRDDFKVTTPEIDLAVEAARAAGALGSRITGGGFGGCTITLAPSEDVAQIEGGIADAFAARGYRPVRFWLVKPSGRAHPVD
jgi:galactokinase